MNSSASNKRVLYIIPDEDINPGKPFLYTTFQFILGFFVAVESSTNDLTSIEIYAIIVIISKIEHPHEYPANIVRTDSGLNILKVDEIAPNLGGIHACIRPDTSGKRGSLKPQKCATINN